MKNKKAGQMRRLGRLMWLYPPYIGAGISVRSVSDDALSYVVQLKQRWYNRNAYGTHFGGSLYSMVDPFYVFVAAAYFGDGYILWDKSASIDYVRPGKGTVTAHIAIPPDRLAEMKAEVDSLGKQTFTFNTQVIDHAGSVVAEVEKTIYIRKKS